MASLTQQTTAPLNEDSKVADAALKMSRIDPSLIHQVTKLQADNQDLYQQRRELEQKIKEEQDKLKAEQEEKEVIKGKMAKMQEEYASANRKEMTEFRENFMREWMVCSPLPTLPLRTARPLRSWRLTSWRAWPRCATCGAPRTRSTRRSRAAGCPGRWPR
jgi:hypothetical protein